jgi:hypothetical protein
MRIIHNAKTCSQNELSLLGLPSQLGFWGKLLFALICAVMVLVLSLGAVRAQGPTEKGERKVAPNPTPPKSPSSKVGISGFKVVIPEIKMKSITGGRVHKKISETEPTIPKEAAPQRDRQLQEPPREQIRTSPKHDAPSVSRPDRESVDGAPVDTGPVHTSEKDNTTNGRKIEIPLFRPPVAPEDAVEAVPPKKEMLKETAGGSPPALLDSKPVKENLKRRTVESSRMDLSGGPQESITLQPRHPREVVRDSKPEPQPEAVPESRPMPAPLPEPEPQPPVEARPEIRSRPEKQPEIKPEPQPELLPMKQPEKLPKSEPEPEPKPEPKPDSIPKESLPEMSRPSSIGEPPDVVIPPKESIASPLALEALNSNDPAIREYLKATSPILEELSLLMTRVPSLTIADYDPSDTQAPLVPKELFQQMDSMKRSLQILDSKTFAVIVPPKYSKFHTIIRDSISHTNRACDAIIEFFSQGTPASLQTMQEHIHKAKELIRRTRERT